MDFCDEGEQACVNEPQASLCSDGRYCNGTETCDAALGCLPGTAIDCNDGVACTVDSCNEALDTCNHLADNGLCDNGLWCDGEETCHRTNGCLAGTPQTCDDGVACTADSCNETEKGCDNQPNDAYCADGLFCNGHERCDAVLGCRADSTFTCEDDVACTVDSCDEGSDVCLHTANDALCNDGNPCTSPDTCNAVSGCAHETLPDATECDLDPTRPEVCRDGFCTFGCNNDPDCDDGISCTIDVCQEGFCSHQISDALCDDGLWCNGQEICLPGLGCEQGPAPDCSDGILCTVDTCNEAENRCDNTPNHALCNNGQWCDGTEVCVAEIGCTMGTARNLQRRYRLHPGRLRRAKRSLPARTARHGLQRRTVLQRRGMVRPLSRLPRRKPSQLRRRRDLHDGFLFRCSGGLHPRCQPYPLQRRLRLYRPRYLRPRVGLSKPDAAGRNALRGGRRRTGPMPWRYLYHRLSERRGLRRRPSLYPG